MPPRAAPRTWSGGMRPGGSCGACAGVDPPNMLLVRTSAVALDALTRANLGDEIEAIGNKDKKTCGADHQLMSDEAMHSGRTGSIAL